MAETVLYKKAENFRLSITLERPHVASLPTHELLYRKNLIVNGKEYINSLSKE